MVELSEQVRELFTDQFHAAPAFIVHAPGRVNIIGEHTDYNEGFVFPMPLKQAVWIALRPRADRLVRIYSADFGKAVEFSLDQLQKSKGWPEYIKGVAYELGLQAASLSGWEGVMIGDVPRGAGLSSSAAVEMATAMAFARASNLELDPVVMARAGMMAENEWVGVNTGIMDQMASITARDGYALFLDCRSLHYQYVRLPEDVCFVVMDTTTRRALVDSAYDERRSACLQASKFFGVKSLRDISFEQFEAAAGKLDAVIRKRARHVLAENQRVLAAVNAMQQHNMVVLGRLLNESHASLRDDFEVSNDALNQIVESARGSDGCFGSRMTGAGFGGCAIALVDRSHVSVFIESVTEDYKSRTGLTGAFIVT
jgi:galactokinase